MCRCVLWMVALFCWVSCSSGNPGPTGDALRDGHPDARRGDGLPPVDHPTSGELRTRTFDVVVVGAGTGGTAAAIQAARLGARVALLEESAWIGGQATAAAVSSMDESGAAESDYGLYRELIDRVKAHYQAKGKSLGTCYWSSNTHCFEPRVGRDKLLELVGGAGQQGGALELFLRTAVTAVLRSGGRVTGVRTQAGETFLAKVIIDATEWGDLLPLAQIRYRVGNATSDAPNPAACIQDITYVAIAKKYPQGLPAGLALASPPPGYATNKPQFERVITKSGTPWMGQSPGYPYDFATHAAYRGTPDSSSASSTTAADAAAAAKLTKSGVNWANDYPALNTYNPAPGVKNPTLPVRYLEDRAWRAEASCEARLKTLQFLYYMQTELGQPLWSVADDEDYSDGAPVCPSIPAALRPVERHFPLFPYVRESRRMIGNQTLSAKDMVPDPGKAWSRTLFVDAVAVGGYGNDLHNCSEDATLESPETRADISSGRTFQIPLAAFLLETVDGFLPAEKNFSQTRLANGATRLQPTTMATGQAMGALAALAVKRGLEPRQVKPVLLQDTLVRASARLSLYRFSDVPPGNALWPAVELVSARGLMIGTGVAFGAADPTPRAQAAVVLVRLLGLPTQSPPAVPSFDDVKVGDFGYAEIEALKKANITSGCQLSPPKFCPNDPLTRAQLAVLLARGLKLDTVNVTPQTFTDLPATDGAYASVLAAIKAGLVAPCSSSPPSYCPTGVVLRGAMAEATRAALLLP